MIGFVFRAWDHARMVTYTVHEQPNPPADRIDRAEKLVFVKDGFVWFAALLPPLWFIANRMWFVLIGYIGLVAACSYLAEQLQLSQDVLGYGFLVLHVLIGFEADMLKRWTLEQSGWSTVGTVNGRNIADCERRFFDGWLPSQPVLQMDRIAPATASSPAVHASGIQAQENATPTAAFPEQAAATMAEEGVTRDDKSTSRWFRFRAKKA